MRGLAATLVTTLVVALAVALPTAVRAQPAQQPAAAPSVALGGTMGDRALLVIDGQPRTVAVGASSGGVRLLSLTGGGAEVEIDGRRLRLALGAAPVSVGAAPRAGGGSEIVLTAGQGGHFTTLGRINGKAAQMMVDTGATHVAMSVAQAQRLGIDLAGGRRMLSSTANGMVASTQVSLASVRIGDVEVYAVDATVLPAEMPYVLLGNSFLGRFSLRQDNDTLRLTKRP